MNEYNPKEFFIQFRHENKTTQCNEECLQCYPKPSLAFQTLPVDSYRQVFVETIEKPKPDTDKWNFSLWLDGYYRSIVFISVTLILIILTSFAILTKDLSSLFTQGSPTLDNVICFWGYFSLCTWCPAGVLLSLEELREDVRIRKLRMSQVKLRKQRFLDGKTYVRHY